MSAPTRLGTERLRKLLPEFALPAIIAMTAASLYNMMDSVFIGQGCGPMAMAGLAITFPLMNLSAAFGAMVGVGSGTVIGVKLGQKDYASAERALGTVVMLNIIIGLIFMSVCLVFLDPILRFFGASDLTLPYAKEYMQVLLFGNCLTHLYLGLNDVTRSSGYPRKAMATTLISVAVNAVFNYLFIFILDLGIRGAAIGTLCAQFVAFCILIRHFTNPNTFLRFKRGIFRLRADIARQVLSIGMAPFSINACACLVVLLINNGLREYGGDLYIGAYGISNRILFIFVMVTNGLNQGMQPIVSYNYGAGNMDRFIRAYKLTAIAASCVMVAAFALCMCFPSFLTGLFTTDPELIGIASHSLRIMVSVFPLVGFQIISIGFFTAMGKAKKSIFLSLTRQLLFLTPFLIILPRHFGTDGIWMSMPLSDLVSVVTVGIMVYLQLKAFKK